MQRAEIDAVGVVDEHVEGQPVGDRAESVSVGSGPQHEVEDALGPGAGGERLEDLVGVATVERTVRIGDG